MSEQKKLKPKIEEIIPEYLDNEMKQSAFDFVAHMQENKMSPSYRPSLRYKCNYKGKGICTIRLPRVKTHTGAGDNEFNQPWMSEMDRSKNFWVIVPELYYLDEYEKIIIDEGLQNFIWDAKNIYFCNNCHPNGCAPGISKTIFGREFKNLCGRAFFWFYNPDETTIKCIKRLLELEKQARSRNK